MSEQATSADIAARMSAVVGTAVADVRLVGASHGCQHVNAVLADGRRVFAKAAPGGRESRGAGTWQSAAFAAEANGLRWLAEANNGADGASAAAVPRVLGVAEDLLVIELLPPGGPTPAAARAFGAALARTHAAGAAAFGAPWAGYIASLPLANDAGTDWGTWYAEQRIVPYLRMAHDAGVLSAADLHPVETVAGRIAELAGPPEPPSRIHGDLWAGNVVWSGGRGNARLTLSMPPTATGIPASSR